MRVAVADNDTTVDLDGTSSILIYGAQFEAGSYPSSYIPTAGATVTRAADVMTIPAANLPYSATAMSIQMSGTMTYADEGSGLTVGMIAWIADSNNNILVRLDTNLGTGDALFIQEVGGTLDFVRSDSAYSPGINVPFNIASRHGSTFINGAVDGTALTANLTPTALPDLSSTDMDIGFDFMGTIDLFRVWKADITDEGLAEAST